MGVMAVALFIPVLLLCHQISSSNSRDEGSSSIDTVHPINLRSCQRKLVEARGKICELCEVAEMSRTFSALKADFERELNETREENAEVERKLRSESMELKAELATKLTELRAQIQSERENKTAEIAKLQADLKRTTTFWNLDGWSYLEKTASWYKAFDQKMTFDEAVAYCENRKSHLVPIHSQEENDFVQKLANTLYSDAWFWIGLKKRWLSNPNKGNALEWTDGSSVDFTNWRSGEPDSNTHAALPSFDGKWAVHPSTHQRPFICKCSSQF